MPRSKVRKGAILALVPLVSATLALSACSQSSTTQSSGNASAGGTLKVLGSGDLDHYDPQLAAYVPTNGALRALSRQLISYEATDDTAAGSELKPDLATSVPEPTNDGKIYEFTLRDGATWDTPTGARELTSADVARGFKRICNPYRTSALASYFTTLIDGMDDYCTEFESTPATAADMKTFIEGHDIPGIETPDEKTVRFTLKEAASDFTSMLSLVTASPAPVEALDYLPDSAEYRSNFVSSGPYKISEYTPDAKLVLTRNTNWRSESDPLRKAYVDSIELTLGVESDAAMQQLQAGTADMLFDLQPSAANIQQLKAAGDTKFSAIPTGGVDQFLWINTKTSNNGGALQNLKVREALQYAIDKQSVVQILGGPDIASVTNGIFAPGISGYKEFAPFGDGSGKADPEKAKQLLAEAGVSNLKLKLPYRNATTQDIAQTIQANLQAVGIETELFPVSSTDYYANFLTNHENAVNGQWDIALVGWSPDWVGGAARSVFQPQFTYNGTESSYNYVDYNNATANELAAKALAATSIDEAADLWHQVDETVMKDSPIVSIAARKKGNYHSARVKNFQLYAPALNGDWTNVAVQ